MSSSSGESKDLVVTRAPSDSDFQSLGFNASKLFAPEEVHPLLHAGPSIGDVIRNSINVNSDIDAGFKTVFAFGLTSQNRAEYQYAYECVSDYLSYTTGVANSALLDNISKGAIGRDDFVRQSSFRAQWITNVLESTGRFLKNEFTKTQSYEFNNPDNLHAYLVGALLDGLSLNPEGMKSAVSAFESLFVTLRASIDRFAIQNSVGDSFIFLIVRVFNGNEVRLRSFSMWLDKRITTVTHGKSSETRIYVTVNWRVSQYFFSISEYNNYKAAMEAQLVKDGKETLQKLPNVDVAVY